MLPRRRRRLLFPAAFVLTAAVWLVTFEIEVDQLEPADLAITGLTLVLAGLAAVLVYRMDLPTLELGWVVFTYGLFVGLLDEVAGGPELVESVLTGVIRLVGLVVIVVGFYRTTRQFRSDIAERNERLTVLNRVLRHNLSNDLTAIIGSLEYLEDHTSDPQAERQAEIALDRAWGLSKLGDKARTIDEVLERADAEPPTTRDAVRVVEDAIEDVRREYPDADCELDLPEEAPVTAVTGLEAAVANVVENACEHADDPTVEVRVDADGDPVLISVTDDGPGIPEEELEPFATREETALDHGSGLGLWLVHWIVEKSGGTVEFSNDGGQTVTLRLPAAS